MPAGSEGVANPASWLHSKCVASAESTASAQKATRWRVKNCSPEKTGLFFLAESERGHWAQYNFIQGEHEVDCHLQIWYAETELSIVCTGRSGNISWAAGSRQVLKLNGCEWTWTWMIHGICQSAPTHCWAQSILTFDIPNMSICVTLGWCMFFALYLADLRAPKFFPDTRVLRANLWC